jgi:hypothetical protein
MTAALRTITNLKKILAEEGLSLDLQQSPLAEVISTDRTDKKDAILFEINYGNLLRVKNHRLRDVKDSNTEQV